MSIKDLKAYLLQHIKTAVAVLSLLGGVALFSLDLYADVKTAKTDIENLKKSDEVFRAIDLEFRNSIRRDQAQIKRDINRIDEKLDKLIDIKLREREERRK